MKKAADGGFNDARFVLGHVLFRYSNWKHKFPDTKHTGLKLLEEAFENGSAKAGHLLLQLEFEGFIPFDINKAINRLEKLNDEDAKKKLYNLYLDKKWGKYDPAKGLAILNELAQKDNNFKKKLANFYLNESMPEVYNPEEAIKLLVEMAEAEKSQTSKPVTEQLGLVYINRSKKWDKDGPAKGLEIFKELAQNNKKFKLDLVKFYLNESMPHVYNPEEAVKLLETMAEVEKSETSKPATELLALLYLINKHGIEPDPAKAKSIMQDVTSPKDWAHPHLFQSAVYNYHFYPNRDAHVVNQLNLMLKEGGLSPEQKGRIYCDLGRIRLRNKGEFYGSRYTLAVKDWTQGAELGNTDCMFYLGIASYTGNGVRRNLDKAKEFWKSAADKGHKPSIDQLQRIEGKKPIEATEIKPEDNEEEIKDLDSFRFGDQELEDLLMADKGLGTRISHSMKRNIEVIKKTLTCAFGVFASIAILSGVFMLGFAFPYVVLPILFGTIIITVIVGMVQIALYGGEELQSIMDSPGQVIWLDED